MHYFININNNCHFDSQMQKFNINEMGQPSHPLQPAAGYQQLIQLNFKYIIFAIVKQKDKYINKIMRNFKIEFNYVKHFFKSNLYLGSI